MRISKKTYPQPVLAIWTDDIGDSSIECDVDVEWDRSYYYVNYTCSLENESISELIRKQCAHFIIHVECGKTLFRERYKIDAGDFADNRAKGRITIPASKIKDRTEISIVVCTSSEVPGYMPAGMHSDYGNKSFRLENGDFVAVWQTYKFDLYQDYDPIRKAESIISFQRDKERETGEITVDVGIDKLTAYLPRETHRIYSDLRADKSKEDIILSMLGVPILMEGLLFMKEGIVDDGGVDISSYRRLKWFRSLEKKLNDMTIDITCEESMFVVAQKVFENPCKRAGAACEQLNRGEF